MFLNKLSFLKKNAPRCYHYIPMFNSNLFTLLVYLNISEYISGAKMKKKNIPVSQVWLRVNMLFINL